MMENNKITEVQIINALKARYESHQFLISHTYHFDWESDLLTVKLDGICYEFEVKVSVQDFKADFLKQGKHLALDGKSFSPSGKPTRIPNRFWYVCPITVPILQDIPRYAGLIYYNPPSTQKLINIDKSYNHFMYAKNAPLLHREKVIDYKKLAVKFYYGHSHA